MKVYRVVVEYIDDTVEYPEWSISHSSYWSTLESAEKHLQKLEADGLENTLDSKYSPLVEFDSYISHITVND